MSRSRLVAVSLLLGLIAGTVGLVLLDPRPSSVAASEAAPVPRTTTTPPMPSAVWRPAVVTSGAGYAGIARWSVPAFPAQLRDDPRRAAAAQPSGGAAASVVISGAVSRFRARPAIVYLPPAALVPQPRLLPVVVVFSGQSRGAGPQDLVKSAGLLALMDRFASRHGGVAPVVVVPDQLGSATGNPMCVDSRLGNSATYVMTDVRRWILAHLPVETDRQDWTVAGFSQGGTCSIQFAAAHPDVFGSLVDVSGEEAPTIGSVAATVRAGFHDSPAAYRRATPAWILAHHRYRDEQAFFSVGALDAVYGPVAPRMAARARAAGMTTHLLRITGLRHNWKVGAAGLAWGFDALATTWDLRADPPAPGSDRVADRYGRLAG